MSKNYTALHQRGVTLIEIIIVIVIVGIIAAGSSELLLQGFRSYALGRDTVKVEWQGRVALETMARDLRSIRSKNDISVANSAQITFVDVDGKTINYDVGGGQLLRDVSGQSNNQVVADGVQSLAFTYYSKDALLTFPISAQNRQTIRYIVVALSIKSGSVTYAKKVAIYPWNLGA